MTAVCSSPCSSGVTSAQGQLGAAVLSLDQWPEQWDVTSASSLPAWKTQHLTGAISQGQQSRAGREPVLLKITGGDVFITSQLNCMNLCTAVCESRLRWAARALFLGTQLPLGWDLCGVHGC